MFRIINEVGCRLEYSNNILRALTKRELYLHLLMQIQRSIFHSLEIQPIFEKSTQLHPHAEQSSSLAHFIPLQTDSECRLSAAVYFLGERMLAMSHMLMRTH